MEKEWLTLSELSERAGIPRTTITRYCQTHRAHLENKRFGRRRKYRPNCVQILQNIAEWYSQGMSGQEITERLAAEIPALVEVERGLAKRTAPNVPALVQSLVEDREDRAQILAELKDTLQELTRLVEDLRRPWWERLTGRHKRKTDDRGA